MHIEDEIRNLLEKEVEKKDVRIDSIKLEKEDNNLFLRIVIDRRNAGILSGRRI